MDDRYEKYGVLLKPSPQWAIDLFGFREEHAGDTISYMMWMACKDPAYVKYIPICRDLLKQRKRWPDGFQKENSSRIAKTRIRYGWSKVLYKIRLIPHKLYRTQHGMTRDPYTYFYAACFINQEMDQMIGVYPPRYIYSPTFWAWQRYLFTGSRKWLERYVRREGRGTPSRQYVKDLALVRTEAAQCWDLHREILDMDVRPNKG